MMNKGSEDYRKNILHPLKFKLGMLTRLPSVVFWGVRIKSLSESGCEVTIPFTWRTQNPFQSIYFAAMAGAAELSTGALCQMQLAGRSPHSMLVVDFKMEYYKKANTMITFTCEQGLALAQILDNFTSSGDSATLNMESTGKNESGVIVARAYITWSFKRK